MRVVGRERGGGVRAVGGGGAQEEAAAAATAEGRGARAALWKYRGHRIKRERENVAQRTKLRSFSNTPKSVDSLIVATSFGLDNPSQIGTGKNETASK